MLQKRDVTFIVFLIVFFMFFALIIILNTTRLADITTTINEEQLNEKFVTNQGGSWFERNKKFIAVDILILGVVALILLFLFVIRKKFYSLWEAS